MQQRVISKIASQIEFPYVFMHFVLTDGQIAQAGN